MTVPAEVAFWGPYSGDDITVNFPFTGRIFEATDLVVKLEETATEIVSTLLYPADYSVTGVNNRSGGTVILAVPLATGFSLTIRRIVSLAQDSDIINQGAFHAQIHEDAWDRLAMVDQQLQQQIDEISDASFTGDTEFPLASGKGGRGTATGSVNVLEFGASPSATPAVNRAAIQEAIDSVVAQGGGVVHFNRGTYQIDDTLIINYSNVLLKGLGTGEIIYGGSSTVQGTRILWTGGATNMLAMGPIASTSNFPLSGTEISGITFDGGGLVTVGVFLSSLNQCRFQDLVITNCVGLCLDLTVTSPLSALSPSDFQHCHFDSIILDARSVINTDCGGLRLGAGAPFSDVSVNYFSNFTITVENGNAIHMVNADTNYFLGFHMFVNGTGKAVIFGGSDVSVFQTARNNRMFAIEPHTGPILSQGGVYPAMNNVIEFLTGNGAVQPTIESGSKLFYTTEEISSRHGYLTLCVGDTYSTLISQKDAMGNESLRVYNLASGHIVLTNASATKWVISTVNTDDFRIAPTAGAPDMYFGTYAKLVEPLTDTFTGLLVVVNRSSVITLDQVKIGAENTGGAGKRALVVDN